MQYVMTFMALLCCDSVLQILPGDLSYLNACMFLQRLC